MVPKWAKRLILWQKSIETIGQSDETYSLDGIALLNLELRLIMSQPFYSDSSADPSFCAKVQDTQNVRGFIGRYEYYT